MVTYRRKKGSDTWHSHIECSNWPISDYIEPTRYSEIKANKMCKECESQKQFDKQSQDFYDTLPLKNIPHWYIDLRPDTFDENYISRDFPEIKSCSHGSEGWYRPDVGLIQDFYNDKGIRCIDSQDKDGHNELIVSCWRFHSTGQFVHFLSFEAEKQTKSIGNKQEPSYQIGINFINNTIREIFKFAETLARYLNTTAFIKIRIVNIKRFVLYQDGGLPMSIKPYPAFEDPCLNPIKLDKTSLTPEDMNKLARKATVSIFKSFNVNNITEDILKKM